MCWDNDKKERRKRACCFAQTNPYQQTNLEGRGKACAMTRKWNRQRYILLWQPFQLKNKQNRTGHKLYANWYNQRINATEIYLDTIPESVPAKKKSRKTLRRRPLRLVYPVRRRPGFYLIALTYITLSTVQQPHSSSRTAALQTQTHTRKQTQQQ